MNNNNSSSSSSEDRNGSGGAGGGCMGGANESGEMGVAQAIPLEGARFVDMGNGHRVLVISSSPSRPAPAPAGGDGTWLRRSDVVPVLVSSYDGRPACGGIPSVKSEGEAGGDNNGLMRVLTFDGAAGGAAAYGGPDRRDLEVWRRAGGSSGMDKVVVSKPATEGQLAHAVPNVGGSRAGGGEGSEESYAAAGLSQSLVVHDDQHALLTGYAKEVFCPRYLQPQNKPRSRLSPKERNRLAQKRFRDRQKALIASLQNKVNDLTTLLRHYQSRTAHLEREHVDLVDALTKQGVAWPSQQ